MLIPIDSPLYPCYNRGMVSNTTPEGTKMSGFWMYNGNVGWWAYMVKGQEVLRMKGGCSGEDRQSALDHFVHSLFLEAELHCQI